MSKHAPIRQGIFRSFRAAFRGLLVAVACERNFKIHCFGALSVIALGYALEVDAADWCLLFFAIGFVQVTEILNTSIERLSDVVTKEIHPLVRDAKDLAAGAVLLASLIAAVIGLFVFLPYLLDL